jgi:phenylpyruvate tautomerase PptA (4-oxalocrotonate tautomerase family)
MPITVTAPEGRFSPQAERDLLPRLTASLLKWNQLTGNAFMTPNVGGTVNILPKERIFAGGKPTALVLIELKLPLPSLASQEQKAGFIAEATAIVDELTNKAHPKEQTWVNILYAPDGAWGIGGKAYTNAELGEAITQAGAVY